MEDTDDYDGIFSTVYTVGLELQKKGANGRFA